MTTGEMHPDRTPGRWAKYFGAALLLQGVAALLLRGGVPEPVVKAAPLEVELVSTAAAPLPVAPAASPLPRQTQLATLAAAQPSPVRPAEPRPAPVPVAEQPVPMKPEPQVAASPAQQTAPTAVSGFSLPVAAPSSASRVVAAPSASPAAGGNSGSAVAAAGAASPSREPQTQARPNYLHNPHPPYPPLARRRGLTGTVLLKVMVARDGSAKEVAVRTTSGYAVLDEAAVATVQRWRFTPAKRGESTLDSWVDVPIRFQLEGREG